MSQYKLYTGGPYTQNNGTAITATSTDINGGAAKGISDNSLMSRAEWNNGPEFPQLVGGVDGVVAADLTAGETISSFSESSEGLVQCVFANAHNLIEGDQLYIDDSGFPQHVYRVVRVVNSTTLVINEDYNNHILYSDITTKKLVGTFGEQTSDNFIIRKTSATVHGQTGPNELSSGGSDTGTRRKIAKYSDTIRTVKTATAIREGKYNHVNGTFDSAYPATSNDSLNSDDETVDSASKIGLKGEFTYKVGATPTSDDYDAKNN